MVTVLLDAHLLLWAIYLPERLSDAARSVIVDTATTRLVSDATVWEILAKAGRGKLPYPDTQVASLYRHIQALRVTAVPITAPDILTASTLPMHHHDPFDRMLIAQAMRLNAAIATIDTKFSFYGVQIIW